MIYVIGLGFVGLTTAIGLAYKKNNVVGIDSNSFILEKLQRNEINFFEPHLKKYLKIVKKKKLLNIKSEINLSKEENFFFICVGTPSKKNGSIDLSIIINSIEKIISCILRNKIKSDNFIILKSTVIPGTVEFLEKKYKKFKNLYFVSNPEFLREGYAWIDFIKPDKIVIGSNKKITQNKIEKIYKNFKSKIIKLDTKSSEFLKYLSNTALANMISFSNEMLILAEKNKIYQIKKIFEAFQMDKRWFGNPGNMSKYYHPGIGFGGYCLPKDLSAIVSYAKKNKNESKLLQSILYTNKLIFNYQLNKILKNIKKNSKIYLLGMSFKPFSDDLRESISLKLAKKLVTLKYKKLIICDPMCETQLKKIFKKNEILLAPKIEKDSVYVLLTAWPEYVSFIKKNINLKILDLRYTI